MLHVDNGVAVVTLADPATRNALTSGLTAGIADAFDLAEADPDVRAVVLTADPPCFSSGGYLPDLAHPERPLAATYEAFLRVARCPLPTVAAVDGPALGAGTNLVLACDLVLVSPRARFESRFAALALHPGGGHAWRLRRKAGLSAALALAVFGETLDADAAVRVGWAWRIAENVLSESLAIAGRLAHLPRDLVVDTKATVHAASDGVEEAQAVEAERVRQEQSMATPEFHERVARLLDR